MLFFFIADSGRKKFELQQGATSTTKQTKVELAPGVFVPANEVTTVPTGELKSVKKKN